MVDEITSKGKPATIVERTKKNLGIGTLTGASLFVGGIATEPVVDNHTIKHAVHDASQVGLGIAVATLLTRRRINIEEQQENSSSTPAR